ncbi:MAG: Ig-like domain-containing protein [Paludibacteraceae bacterium]|nr:Ig-like domain-containing protein [Paludibacteraceae bacterium]
MTNPNSLAVAYTSNNTDVATVADNGAVTIKAAGVATITASFAGNDTYKAGSASYTIGVTSHAGAETDPYDVADARNVIDALGTKEGVYMSGKVSQITTAYDETHHDISFDISTDGITAADQVRAYRCKGLNNTDFTSEDDVKTGATVTVYGNLTKYNSTYEYEAGCYLTAYEAPVVAAPTFSPAAGTYTEVKSVTITCTTEGATIYYTTDGTTPTSSSTQYTAAISVGETMTIKAIAIKNSLESAVATAAYTINLPEDENTSKTWDLSVVSCDENPTDELMQWTATYVTMAIAKGSGTKVTNYYPGTSGQSYKSTRFYKDNTLTFTPKGDKKFTIIRFKATSANYATALKNSTWTNATAAISSVETTIVEITPTKVGAISAMIGGTCGFTQVHVEYEDAPHVAVTGVTLDQSAVTLKAGRSTTLVATVAPDDANNQNVTWSSSNEAIATVANGEVTAVAIGNATITVTTEDGNFTATCAVTVTDPNARDGELAAFKKVTATGDITDGQYLIVYEGDETNGAVAFDAALETLDAAHNTIDVTIEDGMIVAYDDAAFTIDVTAGTIKSYGGKYIGVSSNSNGLKTSTDASTYTNTFAISDGNAVISAVFDGSTMTLRFNKGTNDMRFRYYKSGQQAIQLYKKVDPTSIRGDLTAGKWGTICPQKKVLVPQGASFYTLTYKEVRDGAPYKVFFDEIGEGESLIAGKPYLFIAEGTDILGVETGDAATSAQNYNGFYGIVGNSAYTLSVSQAESDAYKYYIIYQNQIRRCGVGDFTMAVGRAYINMSELSGNAVAPAPGRRRVGMENPEAPQHYTGIDATMSNGKAVKMIIGEQLFILRDGKLYDTTGRFITNMQ